MALPIEDYAIIADTQTAALVGRNGSIDWLCVPRFDSGAIFAALLGDEENGHWTISPADGAEVTTRRWYRDETLVLETEFETPEGVVRLVDFMPPRTESPSVVRIVEGVRGEVDMSMVLRLRFDYGNVVPWVYREQGALVAVAGPDAVWLRTPAETRGENMATRADFTVRAGDQVPFVLTWRPSHLNPPEVVDPVHQLGVTEGYWRGWVSACTYEGEWRDAVVRSLLTLKALTYAPTGGIVAAATTSLPEKLGGVRNWDYRFCWLRDATITLQALLYSGFQSEATAWRKWLLRAIAGNPAELQIMYGVAGERRLDEYIAHWLTGYDGNPVRIGNAAAEQFQLDVYGEVMDALHQGRRAGLKADDPSWGLQVKLMQFVEEHWRDPDEGIWEVRGGPQQFVHSKLMAWVAADRAVKAVEEFALDGPLERWTALREETPPRPGPPRGCARPSRGPAGRAACSIDSGARRRPQARNAPRRDVCSPATTFRPAAVSPRRRPMPGQAAGRAGRPVGSSPAPAERRNASAAGTTTRGRRWKRVRRCSGGGTGCGPAGTPPPPVGPR